MTVPTTVVLVHGGWHGPWCWEPIVPGLEQRGLDVVAVQLPMRTLDEDAAIVCDAVAEAKRRGRVCVVGHSYAGQVVNAAGHGADRLVYVAAMDPDQGQSIFEALGEGLAAIPGLVFDDGNIVFTRDTIPAFYGCCDDTVGEWAFGQLRPFAAECATTPLAVPPAWRSVPALYVICSQDLALAPEYQRARAALKARSLELTADHSAFCSATADLTTAIADQALSTDQTSP
ncbi:alpha/beta hydrolase [[Mycobacterium] vasticus]|uniref:Alpha/beta hydrolase n=1 Tax=[Mycobacterium] vasticus TaxID=2875777 RepID=A0ABU5YYV2_9MYCO|nr:alpha/beta hydrolase [Mycolicibacter sp. MYC017]MEB3070293.1 alpha/beta hydrolase [Mycolicibacter sp. MYC017]